MIQPAEYIDEKLAAELLRNIGIETGSPKRKK